MYYKVQLIEFDSGVDIVDAVRQAVRLAKKEKCVVKFILNKVLITVQPYNESKDYQIRHDKLYQ